MSSSDGRELRALWFGTDVSLIGHLHTPTGDARDLCAVICPVPFGYENICSHRSLRVLADQLARAGIASLRFDFPGTGDSDELTIWMRGSRRSEKRSPRRGARLRARGSR